MLNYTSKKFLFIFLAILSIALIVWIGGTYLNPETRAERAALKYFEDLEEQYRNDTYGGATPEETLQLFITALEAGDVELASKYFVVEKQEEELKYLEQVMDVGNLNLLISELSKVNYSKKDFNGLGNLFIFDFYNKIDDTHIVINIGQISNNIWKITDL